MAEAPRAARSFPVDSEIVDLRRRTRRDTASRRLDSVLAILEGGAKTLDVAGEIVKAARTTADAIHRRADVTLLARSRSRRRCATSSASRST
jgi:hypothetical protein